MIKSALVALLHACQVQAVKFGAGASPWYNEAPEPAPAFPYVAFELPKSSITHSDNAYEEEFHPTFFVVGLETNIEAISTPYAVPQQSVIAYLDSFMQTPEKILSGPDFECFQFLRLGWELKSDPEREVGGGRVWVASAEYELKVSKGG